MMLFLRLPVQLPSAVFSLWLFMASTAWAAPANSTRTSAAVSLTVTPGSVTICAGSVVSLSANGCKGGTLRWETGAEAGSIVVSPGATRAYSVTCTSGTEQASGTATVLVNPALLIGSASQTICAGETLDLTEMITGYETLVQPEFRLSTPTGPLVREPVRVAPTETSVYYLTAQNSSGCSGTATISSAVNALPQAATASLSACADGLAQATFNLFSLTNAITSDPDNDVTFFRKMDRQEPLTTPSGYQSASGTVYAQVLDTQQTGCAVDVPVSLLAAVCGCSTGNCLPIGVRMVRMN